MHTKNYRSYDIDPMIYQELKWFCFRYDRMKAERSVYYAPKAMNYDGIRCENCSGNSGESNALKAMKLSEDIDLIDKALELTADEPIRSFLKKNVTQKNMPYERLGNVPMGRQQFYEIRRKFFYILKTLKIG